MSNLALPAAPVKEKVTPTIIAQGKIVRIMLQIESEQVGWLNPEAKDAIKLVFRDFNTGFYIQLFDHRKVICDAFANDGLKGLKAAFRGAVPCLGRFAFGKGQYIVLADIDDPQHTDMKGDQEMILCYLPNLDREEYRVVTTTIDGKQQNAYHRATRICFAEPRPKE